MGERRLGLALSGGGFRAAFFHLGVLAQMAEQGLLRSVEAISTVSGGSIIGALYYLHVKRLLESKTDQQITDRDYVEIVTRIEIEFLKAVQRNIRMRTFLNPLKNLKMCLPSYSRSDRIGELYDEYLYRPALDPQRSTPIEMRELKIQPKGGKADFYPKNDNSGRSAKVPIIAINATTLNTGHNWRFEAAHMGEPKRDCNIQMEIDKNMRLRRAESYDDIVKHQQNFELGLAVAASACVPAIFPPLAVSGLYGKDGGVIRVQLVDGGVYDNQGVEGLVDPDEIECTHLIVSDASGQLQDDDDPGTGAAAIVPRTNDIFMERLRQEELSNLLEDDARVVALMHLRKGLAAREVPWNGPDGSPTGTGRSERDPPETSEGFGVSRQVQDLLSRVRTDLDSFSDVEAYSLMFDGYSMSKPQLKQLEEFRGKPGASPSGAGAREPAWRFLAVGPWMKGSGAARAGYDRHLKAAGKKFFKIFWLSWPILITTLVIVLGALVGLWFAYREQIEGLLAYSFSIGDLLLVAALFALGYLAPKLGSVFQALRALRTPAQVAVQFVGLFVVAVAGSWLIALHLAIFDFLFLRNGRIEKLGPPPNQ